MVNGWFEFWAKEWPVIAQAPHIVIPGVILLVLAAWFAAWFFARMVYVRQIATLRERITLAQERTTAAQDKIVDLTEQIQSNARKEELLKTAKSASAELKSALLVYVRMPENAWKRARWGAGVPVWLGVLIDAAAKVANRV
jgi:hypothetical protein